MFSIEKMLQTELSFYDSFTRRLDTKYGKIYFNPDNPLSHDSNHAHIMKNLEHPEKAILEIKRFYKEHGLTPRIYPSFLKNELKILRPYLEKAGFTIQVFDNKIFYFPYESQPLTDSVFPVKRITEISDEIIELIYSDHQIDWAGDWTINVLKNHFKDGRFHLLGLYEAGKCVSLASVKTMEGYSRVDDVLTHKDYRERGFATNLMKYLVGYHRSISGNYLYLWADNPVAIRMYLGIGFKEIYADIQHWTAYIK